ncbi:hypothetical protein [Agrobacterium pusense]|uniref:hypothetical protein n=1 Tax=Agrobacterium pusense TaxID=648995 RepID=UPI000D19BCFB|nr:hypothetical protein [Agrobacterium pusense]
MSALEEIKKAFPNMFRPLKWHHFDGPTEHGCGEWYAHATRGMYHIYDVREKFPNDRPFYAKELSDQFDTLEQAQDAVQNRHELDIVMCLDPDFRSTLESLQRENKEWKRLHDAAQRTVADRNSALNAVFAQNEALRKLLQPFAAEAENWHDSVPDDHRTLCTEPNSTTAHPGSEADFTVGDLRRARTALASTGGKHHAE